MSSADDSTPASIYAENQLRNYDFSEDEVRRLKHVRAVLAGAVETNAEEIVDSLLGLILNYDADTADRVETATVLMDHALKQTFDRRRSGTNERPTSERGKQHSPRG
jgi:hypothetical protein